MFKSEPSSNEFKENARETRIICEHKKKLY